MKSRSKPIDSAMRSGGHGFRWLMSRIKSERATLLGIAARAWSVGTGLITLLILSAFYSPELQGYFYTFYSLVMLQQLFELGLGQVIIQFASHEWAHLQEDAAGRLRGGEQSLSRLASLVRFSVAWFGIASIFLVILLGAVGLALLDTGEHARADIDWQLPWMALSIASGIDLALISFFFLLEGCNKVEEVYFYRFVRSILTTVAIWAVITLGGQLWAPAAGTCAGVIWGGWFLWRRYRHFFANLWVAHSRTVKIDWRLEILPMQWRLAVGWISGYFAYSLFTPVLFMTHGPVVAGQMGMLWSIIQALWGVSTLIVLVRAPRFGMLVAMRNYTVFNRSAFRTGAVSIGLCMLGALAIAFGIYLLEILHMPLSRRLLPLDSTLIFLAGAVVTQIIGVQAIYLRAHKREPFFTMSLLSTIMIGISTLTLGPEFGANGIGLGYLAISLCFSLPASIYILRKSQRELQQQ